MQALAVPAELFRTVATAIPKPRPRPRHRDSWSPAERHLDATLPVFRGRHLATEAQR